MPIRRTSNQSSQDTGFYNPEVYSDVGSRKIETLWTPTYITTSLWLDAEDSTTITSISSGVSEWRDKSGNSRHATQTISSSRPLYSSGFFNSKSGLQFDGSNDFLQVAHVSALNMQLPSGTVSVVYSWTGVGFRILQKQNGFGTEGDSYFISPGVLSSFAGGFATSFDSTVTSGVSYILVGTWDGNVILNYLNGAINVPLSVTNASIVSSGIDPDSTPFSNTDPLYIGQRFNPIGSSGNLGGTIAEIVFTPNSLDTSTRQKLEGYFAHKWNMTSSLPSGHPYVTLPPYV